MQRIIKMLMLVSILASGLIEAGDAYLSLTITTPSEVEVYVDGRIHSKYSDAAIIPITSGSHHISFRGNGYQAEDWDISPSDGETLVKEVKLVPIQPPIDNATLTKLVVRLGAKVQSLQQKVDVLQARDTSWVACGNLSQLVSNQLPNFPLLKYEYAIEYNLGGPMPINITSWNYGTRVYNKYPYFIHSDNPTSMRWGGFAFYKGTKAGDDNCPIGQYRHGYWKLDKDNVVIIDDGNGCLDRQIYCRLR